MTSWRKGFRTQCIQQGLSIYELAVDSITTRGEDPYIWLTKSMLDLLSATQNAADEIISQMRNIAETIPEYKVLRAMRGVGDRLGQLFSLRSWRHPSLSQRQGIELLCRQRCPPSIRTIPRAETATFQKRGSSTLRKACYEVMQALKLTKPQDDPVYPLFMLKKSRKGSLQRSQDGPVEQVPRITTPETMELYK